MTTATITAPVKLNRHDAAEYVGVSYATLCTWASIGGGPPYIRAGRKVWYLQRDLDAWIDSRRVSIAAELDD